MSASETAAAVAAASGTALAAGGGEYDATVRGAAAAWAARLRLGAGGAAVLLEARDVGRGRGSGTLLGVARVLAAAFCGFCDLMAVGCLASAGLAGGAAAAGLAARTTAIAQRIVMRDVAVTGNILPRRAVPESSTYCFD